MTTPPKSTCCPECFGCKQTKSTHPRTGIVTTTTERGSGYCKDTKCPCHTQSTELEKTIPLTRGYVAKVDADDYDELMKYKWHACHDKKKGLVYANRVDRVTHKGIRMARQIMDAPMGLFVDHINHDTLDNRKANLRITTSAENTRNRKGYKNDTSNGIFWCNTNKRWFGQITVNSRKIFLGFSDDTNELARRVEEARGKYQDSIILDYLIGDEWNKALRAVIRIAKSIDDKEELIKELNKLKKALERKQITYETKLNSHPTIK